MSNTKETSLITMEQYLNMLDKKDEIIKELQETILSALDGLDIFDIQSTTGCSIEEAQKIKDVYYKCLKYKCPTKPI